MNPHTANIAIKPVATVNKTSQRGLPPLSEAVGDPDEPVSKATPGSCSLVDGAELRLSFALFFVFVLGALGVELIVVETSAKRDRQCFAEYVFEFELART